MKTDEEILSAEFEMIISQLREKPKNIYDGIFIFLKSLEFILKFLTFAIQSIAIPIFTLSLLAFVGIILHTIVYNIFL
ncbi:hypothetical protein ACQ26G_004419 [Yersinia enterocolitica]|uniref:hypothetical protein n=1 Tax=Yersinia enterocolitica TaxID=630 RepID=UPI001C60B9A8|nr:hypothetical protein [Yersinia enterocolitica]MBW5822941.1 hypothetical protein [Yersinia enterocolitica]MBW5853193.1 hypothetical protein [Yersinia enterocolitica]MBW5870551.1 hypothetical protein [Yersinia enterocolitica]MBW5879454.1 hypothetical protein [Yersinia enterocolitica]MBX9498501.1 hypothetical protein [Yersinia enterocolitica]